MMRVSLCRERFISRDDFFKSYRSQSRVFFFFFFYHLPSFYSTSSPLLLLSYHMTPIHFPFFPSRFPPIIYALFHILPISSSHPTPSPPQTTTKISFMIGATFLSCSARISTIFSFRTYWDALTWATSEPLEVG